jgi:hypothetical protein
MEEQDTKDIRESLKIAEQWLEESQGFDFPEALQLIQELKEGIVKGNEILEHWTREEEEERRKEEARKAEKVRKKAMKAREEEDSRRGQNAGKQFGLY